MLLLRKLRLKQRARRGPQLLRHLEQRARRGPQEHLALHFLPPPRPRQRLQALCARP